MHLKQGFEILFGIIRSEGGSSDAGIVVKDCLQICCNMLQKSEICQRFFFGMGKEWILNLMRFFSPSIVESITVQNTLGYGESEGDTEGAWFDEPIRVGCAALALLAIADALEVVNPKHQKLVALQTGVVPAAAFWLARKGPDELAHAALLLLTRVVESNSEVASQLADMMVDVSPAVHGRTHPLGLDLPLLTFGWRPLPSDERRCITLPALLAERYIYSSSSWRPTTSATTSLTDINSPDGLSVRCLDVLESFLRADSSTCDLMVQYILAPPPPSGDDDGPGALESMRYVLIERTFTTNLLTI